jgi:hypothetical protein
MQRKGMNMGRGFSPDAKQNFQSVRAKEAVQRLPIRERRRLAGMNEEWPRH